MPVPLRCIACALRCLTDGSVCIGTPFDPLFFALPLLEKSSRSFSPLQTILAGDLDVNLLRNLVTLLSPERLAKVCDLNGMAIEAVKRCNVASYACCLDEIIATVGPRLKSLVVLADLK